MRRWIFLFVFLPLFTLFIYAFILPRRFVVEKEIEPEFGFSFSHRQATDLGLDWQETYLALLDGLKPKSIRIPVYWQEVEKEQGKFNFKDVDWQIEEAEKREIAVVLVIGYRSFHRPECYPPDWVKDLSQQDFEEAVLSFLKEGARHFSKYNNIEVWQVENEPLDLFRPWCRRLNASFVTKEIEVIRASDSWDRPILLTFGGEIFFRPLWKKLVPKVDIIGISFYPKVWNGLINRYVETYKLGVLAPRNIAIEKGEAMRLGKRFWIVEFQAEPWGPKPIVELSPKEAKRTMSPTRLEEYLDLVKNAGGVERIYFWGVEWWYKELEDGKSQMWEKAQSIFRR